jgi:peptidoglycan/xylan/chitin deacetylase (PgdA/CDA1 family)
MIGTNILQYWEQFLTAWNHGDDIAVHTWTHPYMTTLDNLDVVAQVCFEKKRKSYQIFS